MRILVSLGAVQDRIDAAQKLKSLADEIKKAGYRIDRYGDTDLEIAMPGMKRAVSAYGGVTVETSTGNLVFTLEETYKISKTRLRSREFKKYQIENFDLSKVASVLSTIKTDAKQLTKKKLVTPAQS